MYDVCMRRTNIYLDDQQLDLLRRLGEQRGTPVAGLVREAVDEWLARRGVRLVPEDEWQRRFAALLARRSEIAELGDFDAAQVDADVADAVVEVRAERSRARRR